MSANGTQRYLSDHVVHDLFRWFHYRTRTSAQLLRLLLWTGFVAFLAWLAAGVLVPNAVAVAMVVVAGWCGYKGLFPRRPRDRDLAKLVRTFESHNRSDLLAQPLADAEITEQGGHADALLQTVDKVLVCETREIADCLVSNKFHLQHACLVLGPRGYGADLFPHALNQLRERHDVVVFALHNYTPAGAEFARSVRQNPSWLGLSGSSAKTSTSTSATTFEFVDLGLSETQKKMYKWRMRPLSELGSSRARGTSKGMGVALTSFRPDELFAMVALGLEQRAPIAVPEGHSDAGVEYSASDGDSE